MLANVTLGEWEQIEREFYIDFCTKYIALNSNSGLGLEQFDMTMGTCEIDVPSGGFGAIGVLSQEVLNRFYEYLARQARTGALGMKDASPVFGLITSPETSTGIIRNDATRNADMRYANPGFLLEGYGTVETYQNFAHIKSMEVPRFKVSSDGTHLERVHPLASSATTIGEAVNIDMDYIMAPFELSVVFLKDVFEALVPPSNPKSLAGGAYTFDPADNMGEFHWKNIEDRCENILKEKGFFFARFRIAPKPGMHSTDAVCILHRRCVNLELSHCGLSGTCDDTTVIAAAQADSTEAAADATEYDVELEANIDCGPGMGVTVTFDGALTADAIIVTDANAPTYRLAFSAGTAGGWAAYDGGMATVQCAHCPEEEQ